jgi:hypothetical protein
VRDDRLYLGHILEAVDRILLFGQDGEGRFRTVVVNHIPPLRDTVRRALSE